MTGNKAVLRLESVDLARRIVDQWVESLREVLESMTDQKPEIFWQSASGSWQEIAAGEGQDVEVLWWEQQFSLVPGAAVWVGAPRATWEHAGTQTLKAAGLESVEIGEARSTWFEIAGQSLGVIARALTALAGHEVAGEPGAEHAPAKDLGDWAAASIALGDAHLPRILFGFSPELLEVVAAPPEEPADAPAQTPTDEAPPLRHSRTMELLLDVDLPISISFGRTKLPMKDVLKLTTGSIVELNRDVNDPVEVLVNHCLIARGEVVVVEGNYGVRIQEIASRQDRLRSIR